MQRCKILNINNKKSRELFLSLPKKLYKRDCPQNYKTEKLILEGRHCLSKDFTIYPFVAVDENGAPIARCLLTCYEHDETAYVGFFESVNSPQVVKEMMVYVERTAKDLGKKKLLGPIDSSIYIRYRFKTNEFDSTYSGEPYNKAYYDDLWKLCGFITETKYTSNRMRVPTEYDLDERLIKMYAKYTVGDYKIISPTKHDFDHHLKNVYKLMMESYQNFNGFQRISENQFCDMFSNFRKVLNYSMVRLLYKNDQLKGFAICMPNYSGVSNERNFIKKMFAFGKIRKTPTECIILYVGADSKAIGVGGALMEDIKLMCQKNKLPSIGALIREGNAPDRMYTCLKTTKHEYVLLAKTI